MREETLFIGWLIDDPAIESDEGREACTFTLRSSEPYPVEHKIYVYGKQIEHCMKYLVKGACCLAEGYMKTNILDGTYRPIVGTHLIFSNEKRLEVKNEV